MSGNGTIRTETTRGTGDSFSKHENWDITDPPEERGEWGDKLAAMLAEIMRISPGGLNLKFLREGEREGIGHVEIYEATFDSIHRAKGEPEGGVGMKSRICFEVASTNILGSFQFGLNGWRRSVAELDEKGYVQVLRPSDFAQRVAAANEARAKLARQSKAVLGALQKALELRDDPEKFDAVIADVESNPDLEAEAKAEVLATLEIMRRALPESRAEDQPAPTEAN